MIRTVLAPNPSAMTLDGTRTFIVGTRHVAIIDPGPDIPVHLEAIRDAVTGGGQPAGPGPVHESSAACAAGGSESGTESAAMPAAAVILLTHTHPDHAAAAERLAERLSAEVRGVARGNLHDDNVIVTDAGPLATVLTPGHTPDHASFHLRESATVFCGDLMMGGLDTTLISPPEGNLRDYLESLDRIRALRPARILPTHGPPFEDAGIAISRYVAHRRKRCDQVALMLHDSTPLSTREVAERLYGDEVPEELQDVAVGAVVAYLEYLETVGRVVRSGDRWSAG